MSTEDRSKGIVKWSTTMHRRLKAFERRLAALGAVLRGWSVDPERERQAAERRKVLAVFLRAGLEHAGVDPNEAASLRRLEDPDGTPAIAAATALRPSAAPPRRTATPAHLDRGAP